MFWLDEGLPNSLAPGKRPRITLSPSLALRGGEPALAAFHLRGGRPVRPMLASPADDLDSALSGDVSVEYKLDGARIQVHRNGDEVHVYTRTLREITRQVPELVALVRELPCSATVLDGETLALTDGSALPLTVAEPDHVVRGGLVVLHEARGVTDRVRSLMRSLAEDGWLTAAPHLYHRDGVEGFDDRGKAPSVVIVDRAGVASSFAIMSVVGEQTNDIFFFGVCLSV